MENVEVTLLEGQTTEGLGSIRKVHAMFNEKRRGWYREVRTEHVDGRSIAFLIYDDSFGMDRMLSDVGGRTELEPVEDGLTHFTFTFYHRPKNLLGRLMNPIIPRRSAQESPQGPRVHQAVRRDGQGHQERGQRSRSPGICELTGWSQEG